MKSLNLRSVQTEATRERILEGVAAVLESGAELTFAAVSQASGVQERTLYRHFADKRALESAFWRFVHQRMGDPVRARDEATLLAQVPRVFRAFDERSALVRAMLRSPEGLAIRLAANHERQSDMLAAVASATAHLDPTTRRRAAALCQLLYSASAWQSMHDYWGMDGDEASATATLGIELILGALRARPRAKGAHPSRRPQRSARKR